jgi:RimJ/RimL family protein N-acetyltransferase
MFDHVCRSAKEHRITRITLAVGADNIGAQRFYLSLGFTQLKGEALADFGKAKPDAQCTPDSIVIAGHRYLVFEFLTEDYG